jgi:hypothetical protein
MLVRSRQCRNSWEASRGGQSKSSRNHGKTIPHLMIRLEAKPFTVTDKMVDRKANHEKSK